MRLLICFILAISVTVVVTQRPSYSLSPVDWSVSVNAERPVKTVITGKDLIVDFEFYNPATIIRRRDAQGNYQVVVNLTEISATEATTNGKWIMLTGEGIGLFRLDQQNNLSSLYLVDNAGFVLSDDTIVGFNPFIRNEDGIVTIKTYEFNESNDTWVNIPGTELNVSGPINFPSYSTSSFRVSDTHLSMIDSSGENLTVNIYERQLNKSWSQIESVQIDGSHGPGSIIYNDVDTFVHSIFDVMVDEGLMGIVYIYTKSNGQWKEQSFTVSSVGYRSIGYLGGSVQFLDANNVLISAGYDGYDGSGTLSASSAGRVLLLTRNATGAWEPTLDLVSPSGIFGIGIGVNDYDILIPSIALGNPSYLTYNTAPRCFAQPINVTCSNQQVNDCSDVDVSSLFTVNNSPQCFTVKSSLNSVSLSNNEMITAQFSFTKAFGATAYCNATVSCPLPPSMTPVTQQLTPSKVSSSTAIEIGVLSLLVYVILL